MNSRAVSIVLQLAIVLMLAPFASAQDWWMQMQLLSTNVGWTFSGGDMVWTNDNGRHWKEITPDVRALNEGIVSVFFLDTSRGWALLSGYDDPSDAGLRSPKYGLAFTKDSGATWSVKQLNIPVNPNECILLPQGYIQFTDATHGWMNLDVQSGAAFHSGILLRTVDGGKNWTWAPGPGTSGEIRFINQRDGWVVSPEHNELWVTHDGGTDWKQVSLKPPPRVTPADVAAYQLPVFADGKHGALEIGFSTPPTQSPDRCQKSLFVTADGGKSWKFRQVLTRQPECGRMWPVAAADSVVLTPETSGETLTLKKVALGGKSAAASTGSDIGFPATVLSVSFVSPQEGWISTIACCKTACSTCVLRPMHGIHCGPGGTGSQCPALLSTIDGGKSWTDITLRETCMQDLTGKKTCTVQ
jgi:photosystem II stability/assembly factor-like uncharacterized protein